MMRLLAKAFSNLKCLLYLNEHVLGDLIKQQNLTFTETLPIKYL